MRIESSYPIAKIITDYQCAYPDPLILKSGDQVIVEQNDTQWPAFVWCTDQNGKGGWVPEQYLERQGNVGVIRVDYNTQELTVLTGEMVQIKQEAGGWYWCLNEAGQQGWVPGEHLQIKTDNK